MTKSATRCCEKGASTIVVDHFAGPGQLERSEEERKRRREGRRRQTNKNGQSEREEEEEVKREWKKGEIVSRQKRLEPAKRRLFLLLM